MKSGIRQPNYKNRLKARTTGKVVRKAKSSINPFYGKKHSEETKKKLSEYRKGKKPGNQRKVLADGKLFESVRACARYYDVCEGTVISRIKSIKWNWNYVN